jgi:OOP family OmpA-OmpF porin
MRISSLLIVGSAFLVAAILSLVAAFFSVGAIEASTEIVVRKTLDGDGHDWAEVQANGLQVILSGTAPDEAGRFGAISVVGGVVDAARIIDSMHIAPTEALEPPRFSVEILRNDSGISVIGLIPAATDRLALIRSLQEVAGSGAVSDLLEVASYPVPPGWTDALDYAVTALGKLPRSKISVAAGSVSVTAISDSPAARARLETDLTRAAPAGLRLALGISAPRPVITPFTLRFLIDDEGGRFDACSAESETSLLRIVAAARKAGLTGAESCVIGLGVPSPNWARAAELSIAALAELGQGSVTFSDADITLVAVEGTDHAQFDRVVGELESALPQVFALHAVLPEPKEKTVTGPPEFTATLSPEGLVQMRGRLSDDNLRRVAVSFAKARFGTENVHAAARVVEDLPADWPVRVLAGLESLAHLVNGMVIVTPDNLAVTGISNREDAASDIARLLADKLGHAGTFDLSITYREPPKSEIEANDPELCEARLADAQRDDKITFEPGSARITAESLATLNRVVDILADCPDIRMEIQGHTDSQGREEMNQKLSQARAQSVLNELRARRVLTASYVAVGYGEALPIADNDTEEGREANRRIEFRLIRTEPLPPEPDTTIEQAEAEALAADPEGDQTDAMDDIPDDPAETDTPETGQ